MHSPLYDLTTPSSAGTEPGILAAERKPMMPSLCKQRAGEHGTKWSLGRRLQLAAWCAAMATP